MFLPQFFYIAVRELLSLIAAAGADAAAAAAIAASFDIPLIFYTISPTESSMTSSVNWVPRKTVAIVGTGSAGIGALWALNRTHHDVYVYEAADRLGGHTNTVTWKRGKYQALVDTGFIVMNTATYRKHRRFIGTASRRLTDSQQTLSTS